MNSSARPPIAAESSPPDTAFRQWVSCDPGAELPAALGRYHLYVSYACPWAHRAVIVRALKGLESAVSLSTVEPIRDERGWAFGPKAGETFDPVNGFRYSRKQTLRPTAIDLNELVSANVNSGVYRCGFARSQAAYDIAFKHLFDTLDWLDARLEKSRCLIGEEPTLADWRLFPTLARFDAVYFGLFTRAAMLIALISNVTLLPLLLNRIKPFASQ